ncbi:MAG: transcriptional regulator, TetR family [Thermoleophilia bacterium]|nr:transcriptional regulator, TetR family [Thermoleophilia bacterium]
MTTTAAPGAAASLRVDAARNRARVLDAAQALFAERGLDVGMAEIAEAAGVGVGTVFRRFESKEALVETIVRERVDELHSLAKVALRRADEEPWAAFAEYFVAGVEVQVRNRAFMESAAGLGACAHMRTAMGPLAATITELVETAQRAGAVRADLAPEDVPLLQCAISRAACHAFSAVEPEVWRRPCAIALDGLRAEAAMSTLEPQMPTLAQLHTTCD